MDRWWGAVLVVALACGGAPAPRRAGVAEPVIAVADRAAAHAAIGRQVEVRGTAAVTKLAPSVMAGDLVVYCLGLDEWPDAVAGKPVIARGRLELTGEFEARSGLGGEHSAGTEGPVYVLRACRYEAL